MARGFLYLVAVMDWYSRKVLAWRLSNTMTADCCVTALEEALAPVGRPRSSTPIRAASSPARPSLTCSRPQELRSVWKAKAAGWTTCLSSGCDARLSTRRSTCAPTTQRPRPAPASASILASTTPDARIRRLADRPPDEVYFQSDGLGKAARYTITDGYHLSFPIRCPTRSNRLCRYNESKF